MKKFTIILSLFALFYASAACKAKQPETQQIPSHETSTSQNDNSVKNHDPPENFKIRYAGNTHVGKVRPHNEDYFDHLENEQLYIVADGMGGHAAGEVASRIAVETITQFYKNTAENKKNTPPIDVDNENNNAENRLVNSIIQANLKIYEDALDNPEKKGMGTTVVAINFTNDGAYLAHVGDSRIYRYRQGSLEQLTEDHSLLNDHIKMGIITPDEIENYPYKHVIVRALGMQDSVQVDVKSEKPKNGDLYILCSDGLFDEVKDDDILEILNKSLPKGLSHTCNTLIDTANNNGGKDNITVILTQYIVE